VTSYLDLPTNSQAFIKKTRKSGLAFNSELRKCL